MATEVQNPVAAAVGVSSDGKIPPYSNFESDTVAVKSPPQKSRIPCVALAVALCAAVVANVALGFGIVAYVRVSDNSTSAAPAAAPAAARKCEGSDLTIVRDVKTLTPEEKYKLVAGMKKMKKEPSKYDSKLSAWDYFVSIHKAATVPQEQVHAGWYFYPWHRVMLARFVSELRRVTGDSTIHFPYWNWADIESSASMFEIDYLGPRAGSPAAGYVLVDGNFGRGNWTIDKSLASLGVEKTTLSLARSPGNGLQMCEDAAGNSWMLDTIYNPRNVDNTYLVGPFRKLSPVAPPTDTLKYLHPKPGNVEVDWESLTGQRQYVDDLRNPTMTLTCNHFATTLPTEKDYTLQVTPPSSDLLTQITYGPPPRTTASPTLSFSAPASRVSIQQTGSRKVSSVSERAFTRPTVQRTRTWEAASPLRRRRTTRSLHISTSTSTGSLLNGRRQMEMIGSSTDP